MNWRRNFPLAHCKNRIEWDRIQDLPTFLCVTAKERNCKECSPGPYAFSFFFQYTFVISLKYIHHKSLYSLVLWRDLRLNQSKYTNIFTHHTVIGNSAFQSTFVQHVVAKSSEIIMRDGPWYGISDKIYIHNRRTLETKIRNSIA
jgi:hypothetical protein